MEKQGLCTTCLLVEDCIFQKEPPVVFCEEFFSVNAVPARCKQPKQKKCLAACEVSTESE